MGDAWYGTRKCDCVCQVFKPLVASSIENPFSSIFTILEYKESLYNPISIFSDHVKNSEGGPISYSFKDGCRLKWMQ